MASIGQLVKVVAATSGLDESSVKLVARYVREAGYIFQKSTGAGAAQMSSLDAAALLMGLNGSSAAKDAAEAVYAFSMLPLSLESEMETAHPELIDVNKKMKQASTFGVSLSILIEICSSKEGRILVENSDKSYNIVMAIHFTQPEISASIFVYEEDKTSFARKTILHRVFSGQPAGETYLADRSVTVSISHQTIRAISKAISPN